MSGRLVVARPIAVSTTQSVVSVTDSEGNTYVMVAQDGGGDFWICYHPRVTAGTFVTVSFRDGTSESQKLEA